MCETKTIAITIKKGQQQQQKEICARDDGLVVLVNRRSTEFLWTNNRGTNNRSNTA